MDTRYNRLDEAVLTSTHKLFLSRKMKNIRIFFEKLPFFLVVKFSVYLNSRVFVMYELFDDAS